MSDATTIVLLIGAFLLLFIVYYYLLKWLYPFVTLGFAGLNSYILSQHYSVELWNIGKWMGGHWFGIIVIPFIVFSLGRAIKVASETSPEEMDEISHFETTTTYYNGGSHTTRSPVTVGARLYGGIILTMAITAGLEFWFLSSFQK